MVHGVARPRRLGGRAGLTPVRGEDRLRSGRVRLKGAHMLRQLLVGLSVSAVNIVIHALVMTLVLKVAQRFGAVSRGRLPIFLSSAMTATALVLMTAHIAEVCVWAAAYALLRVAPASDGLVYFAFVNYTTLGYGDETPAARWEILGPMTAMNGVLLFGWSTAVLFEVLRGALALAGHDVGQRRDA
jgi:hypothetical protein